MRIIKKYKNRKLYDTTEKKFVTLKDVLELIKNGEKLRVLTSSGDDVTSEVSLKARFSGDFFDSVRKEIAEKILATTARLLKGEMEQFVNVILELVDEGVISPKMIREFSLLLSQRLQDSPKNFREHLNSLINEGGLVTKQSYDSLKQENEELINELNEFRNKNNL